MAKQQINLLDAPIPGQSLTMQKGAMAFEHPPRFTNIYEATDFILEGLLAKKRKTQVVLLLKQGASCESIARTILMAGCMGSYWTPDMALLMGKTVMYTIYTIGTLAGVKSIKMKNPDVKYEKFLDGMLKTMPQEPTPSVETTTPAQSSIFKTLG